MKHGIRICLFLLTVFAFMACTDSRKVEIIRQAESLMQEQPDSALRVLQTIDRHSLKGKPLARYALIYSIAQDKSGLDVTNDSLIRIAYEYYSQHPEDSLYACSQYYMGLFLCLTAQTDSAYACLLNAKTTSEEEMDYYTAYLATDRLRRMAEVSDTSLCLTLSKDAYQLYVKCGADNPVNEVYLLIGVGDGFLRCENQDSTIHYYNIALNKARLTGDSIVISSVLQNISRYYIHYHQNEKAFECAKQAQNFRGHLDQSLAILLAQCYMAADEYGIAQQYINAIPPLGSKEQQLVKIGLQHKLCIRTGDVDAADEYFTKACDVAADMYLSILKEKLELHDKNRLKELERQRAEFREKIFALCFLFSLAILALLIWLFLKYRRSKKAEINYQKIQNRILEELNKKEKERFLAEESLLRQEKAYKEQVMERTRYYVKNMVSILREVEKYRIEHRKQKEKEKRNNSKSKDGQKEGTHLEVKLDDKAWAEIQAYLEACEGSFVTRFKERYPYISESDLHLCMLLRCGFSNFELEQVYLINHQSVKTKQRLLKEKLGDVDKKTSLRLYINQF